MKIGRSIFVLVINAILYPALYPTPELRLVIDIPTFNNRDVCVENLKSVYKQDYENYRVIITDDCSEDGTADAIWKYVKAHGQEHRTHLIRNKIRRKSLANHYSAVLNLKDSDDVLIHLDGDDFLKDKSVFKFVNRMYQDPEIWVTYGQYMNWPENQTVLPKMGYCKEIPKGIVRTRNYRRFFFYGHLRTCRAWLARHIKLEDCISEHTPCKGNFYEASSDLAFMFPILEMADGRYKFNPKVLYLRNVDNPVNNFKVNRANQMKCAQLIKDSPRYKPFSQNLIKPDNQPINCHGLIFADGNFPRLKRCLDSFKRFIPRLALTVIYEKDNANVDRYDRFKNYFKTVNFVEIDSQNQEARQQLINGLRRNRTDYYLVTDTHNALKKNLALGRYLRLIENTFAYTLTFNAPKKSLPLNTWVNYDVYAWKFSLAKSSWLKPNNTSLSLYRRNDLLKGFRAVSARSLSKIVEQWKSQAVSSRKVGLMTKHGHSNAH